MKEFLDSEWTLRLRKIVNQRLKVVEVESETITTEATICNIDGEQTQLINLYTEFAELKNKIAILEESTVDAETKRELKRMKQQIASLRAEGISVTMGAQYVPGMSYDDGNKPSIEVYAQGYGGDHAAVQSELKDTLKEWFKDQREELELPEPEEPREVYAGFEQVSFDPDRCAEAIEVNGEIRQCKNYKQSGSKYCHIHRKKYEEKDVS